MIVVVGGPTTVQVYGADSGPMLRLESTARTTSVCSPASRPSISAVFSGGAAHSSKAAPSTLHSNDGVGLVAGEEERRRRVERDGAVGPETIVGAAGAVRSTIVQSQVAGTIATSRSGLSASVSSKVCAPASSPSFAARISASVYVFGEVHDAGSEPSIEQRSTSVGSAPSAVKVNVADVASVSPPDAAVGPVVIVRTGGVRSPISHENVAGDWSRAPPAPIAVTSKSCAPGSRPVYVTGEVHGAGASSSSTHSKVAPAWFAENVNVTLVLSVW